MNRIGLAVLLVCTGAHADTMSVEECAVWDRERAFAQSVEDRDLDAFTELVHPDAVFFGPVLQRGRAAAVNDWAPIVAAGELRWYPKRVVIGGDTRVALSQGPYWFPDNRPEAPAPYARGQYLSIWVEDADGEWRVLFDGAGATAPSPMTEAQLADMIATLDTECPR